MGKLCCKGNKKNIGLYKPLSQRLVDMGNECYSDFKDINTILWIFVFYDGASECAKCLSSLTEMHSWFETKGLLDSKTGMVKIIAEPEPDKCKVYTDFGFNIKPMHIICDSMGRILDIFTGLPDKEWLDKHILPIIQLNMGVGRFLKDDSHARRSNA